MMREAIREAIVVIVALAIIFGGEASFIYCYAMPGSIKETREIWTPDQFNIANKFNGSEMIVSEYKSEATEIVFADLLKIYNSSYKRENFTIVALQNGTIWYEWSFQGLSFKAADQQHGFTDIDALPRIGDVTGISSEGQKAYITIVFNYSLWGDFLVAVVFLGIIALGLLVGAILNALSKPEK